jgi:L-ascorbate metabolism protein UlaG (beta-lactamase superfamily)
LGATVSDHFDGRRFHNPGRFGERSLWQVLKWALTRKKQPWPKWVDDPPQPPPPTRRTGDDVALTFVNHSTFLLQLGGVNVLTDPIWSERASPVQWAGPRRVRRPGVAFERLPPIDLILLSHTHYDHLDLPTLRRLHERDAPLIVTGLGNRRVLHRRGIPRAEELDWWQSHHFRETIRITMTPALHYTRRTLFDHNTSLWGGFWIEFAGRKLYFAADTAYGEHFKEIRERLGPPDVALLPIGAFEPRWFMGPAHVNPEEAVQAHLDVGAALSVAMHFGTFQLTDEPIDEPVRTLRENLAKRGIDEQRFRVLGFGETLLHSPQAKQEALP